MQARTRVDANKHLLEQILTPTWAPTAEEALDAITYAAVEDMEQLTRVVLWAVGVGGLYDKIVYVPVISTFAKYFPDVVAANITFFADCCGPHILEQVGRFCPAARIYAGRKSAFYDYNTVDQFPAPNADLDALLVKIAQCLSLSAVVVK